MNKHKDKGDDKKELKDFTASYSCRFHPIDWWHEIGCPHMKWSEEQLQEALDMAKQSNAYLFYLLSQK